MSDADEPEIVTLHSRTVYENRWTKVREDAIRRKDGSESIYGVVEKAEFVVVVPIEPDGSVHLVEQYRYPLGGRYWELPQGAWEGERGIDPLAVARGELREETGLVAGRMTHAGHLFAAPGYATNGFDVYLAQDLSRTEMDLEPEEQGLITRLFPAHVFLEMLRSGEIKDSATLAAIGLLLLKGLYPSPAGAKM